MGWLGSVRILKMSKGYLFLLATKKLYSWMLAMESIYRSAVVSAWIFSELAVVCLSWSSYLLGWTGFG